MSVEPVYQRWLEFEAPAGVGGAGEKATPMWSWPVALSDGRAVVTFLYRPLRGGEGRVGPRTVILELSKEGEATVWKPGVGYPAPVIFYANGADDLVGFDLVKQGKVYACRVDGTHLWTLEARLKMGSLIAPELFRQEANRVVFRREDGATMQGRVEGGGVVDVREATQGNDAPMDEARFPHTHVTRDGSVWVFDFDPMPRVSRLRVR